MFDPCPHHSSSMLGFSPTSLLWPPRQVKVPTKVVICLGCSKDRRDHANSWWGASVQRVRYGLMEFDVQRCSECAVPREFDAFWPWVQVETTAGNTQVNWDGDSPVSLCHKGRTLSVQNSPLWYAFTEAVLKPFGRSQLVIKTPRSALCPNPYPLSSPGYPAFWFRPPAIHRSIRLIKHY
jgi:hypothetical protein